MSNVYENPFPMTLAAVRKGALVNELTEKLAEVVAGVVQFEKAGTLTLKLTVKPLSENSEMVVIEDDLTIKVPRPDGKTWFYATEDGGLARENPTPELPGLRPVKDAEES